MKNSKLILLATITALLTTSNAEAWDNNHHRDKHHGRKHGYDRDKHHGYGHKNHYRKHRNHHNNYGYNNHWSRGWNFINYSYPSYNYVYQYPPVRYNPYHSYYHYPNHNTVTVVFR